jgi:hypothetical protein
MFSMTHLLGNIQSHTIMASSQIEEHLRQITYEALQAQGAIQVNRQSPRNAL